VPVAERHEGFVAWLRWANDKVAALDPLTEPRKIAKRLEPPPRTEARQWRRPVAMHQPTQHFGVTDHPSVALVEATRVKVCPRRRIQLSPNQTQAVEGESSRASEPKRVVAKSVVVVGRNGSEP
jgi:hypothetical protein